MKKICLVLMVLSVLVMPVGQAAAADPIRIGLNEPLSGPFKTNGDRFVFGMSVAVEEINKAGGLLGRPLELVTEDNQMKPEIAVQKMKKMILKDKCEAIFQASSSSVALALAQAMPRYKKIYVAMAAFAVALTGEHFTPYTFRTDANVAILAKTMAYHFASMKKYRKVYLLNQDYSYGHDVATYYEKFIKELAPNTEIVGKDFHPVFNKDFAPYISKIKASGADYLLTGNWGTDLIQVILQGKNLGMNIPVAALLMGDINALAAMPGDEAVGNYGVASFFLGLGTENSDRIEKLFHEKSGGTWPLEQLWIGYKSVLMYAAAVEKAGSLDIEKVIKAFETLTYDPGTGPVVMRTKDHQLMQPMYVGQVVKKTKYADHPYHKVVRKVPAEQLAYEPEAFG